METNSHEIDQCLKHHTRDSFDGKCCKHIRKVLGIMKQQNVKADGDVQVCGLRCKQCDVFHGF